MVPGMGGDEGFALSNRRYCVPAERATGLAEPLVGATDGTRFSGPAGRRRRPPPEEGIGGLGREEDSFCVWL